MGILQSIGRWFTGKTVKENLAVPDGALFGDPRYQTLYSNYLGLYAVIDRMARGRGGRIYDQPLDERMLFIARGLMRTNPYAQGIVNTLRTYTLGCSGFKRELLGDEGAVAEASDYLDLFCDQEDWWHLERETLDRVHIEGEAFLRFFLNDECVSCRYIEPEWVIAPTGEETWTFGCQHEEGDVQTILGYNQQYAGENEFIPAEEVYHIKSKLTPRVEKRGRSDFHASCAVLDDSFKCWKNFLQSEAVRQAIIYFSKAAEGVSGQDLEAAIAGQADYRPATSTRGQAFPPQQLVRGAGVEHLQHGTELASVPSAENVQGTLTGVNAALLCAARPYNMPLWLISGDMSQNNVVDLGHESPFGSAIMDEQAYFSRHVRKIFKKVLEMGVEAGHVSESVLDVDIKVSTEQQPPRDALDATTRYEMLFKNKLLSHRSWSELEGRDYDEEQERIKEEGDLAQQAADAELEAKQAEADAAGADEDGKQEKGKDEEE